MSSLRPIIREENPQDASAVRELNRLAFGGDDEALLVDALRAAGAVTLSLVACVEGAIVGHILFSPVVIDTDHDRTPAVGLGPMCVLATHQRQGIGSALVRAGLAELRARRHGVVVVVGHSAYYPRFGFERGSRHGLAWEVPCPDEAFMVHELEPGALKRLRGVVRYRPEFGAV
jgi:putative acetyltransferase